MVDSMLLPCLRQGSLASSCPLPAAQACLTYNRIIWLVHVRVRSSSIALVSTPDAVYRSWKRGVPERSCKKWVKSWAFHAHDKQEQEYAQNQREMRKKRLEVLNSQNGRHGVEHSSCQWSQRPCSQRQCQCQCQLSASESEFHKRLIDPTLFKSPQSIPRAHRISHKIPYEWLFLMVSIAI